jgi:hypothetical protein
VSDRSLFFTFAALHILTLLIVLGWAVAVVLSTFIPSLGESVRPTGPFVLLGGGAALFLFRRLARRFEPQARA